MKQKFVKLLAICAACFLLSTISFAQNNKRISTVKDTYVISAKAGGVNFVAGKVELVRRDGNISSLKKGDAVEVGEKVSTAEGGKAEILLNPGSFVRLNGNSEFEFISTSLDDLQLRLNGGSAILEVLTTSDFQVVVSTPKSSFSIIKSGIYRVDALGDGTAKLEVWKGKAQVGEGKAAVLKGGQTTVLNSSQLAVVKFDRDNKDDFELWSKERAKELDKINEKLRGRDLNRALIYTFASNRGGFQNSFGLWVRDPFSQNYCFLPFGYGWSSPYGHFYDRSVYTPQQTAAYSSNNGNWNQSNGQNSNGSNGSFNSGNNGGFSMPRSNPDTSTIARPSIVERKDIDRPASPIREN
jgi:hypothetical protein